MLRKLAPAAAALACACSAAPEGAPPLAEGLAPGAGAPANAAPAVPPGGLAVFLPPLAAEPGAAAPNTPGLAAVLELAPADPAAGPPLRVATGAGKGGLRDLGGHYHWSWDTSGAAPGAWRLRVLLEGRELGALVVRVVTPGGGGRSGSPPAVVRGSTAPVKFRILCGADRCAAPEGGIERVSLDSAGGEGNGPSSAPAISRDGRFVAFSSSASNLVPGDLAGHRDVLLRDRRLGLTERVSVGAGGAEADGDSFLPAISADGSRVVFMTQARNLGGLAFGLLGPLTVYLRDRARGETLPLSVGPGGLAPFGDSAHPAISADGGTAAFTSAAPDLVPGDGNFFEDVFTVDLATGATARASLAPGGAEADGPSGEPSLSADGRYLAFASLASNLVAGDGNGDWDVFVLDRATGALARVSVPAGGGEAHGRSRTPRISGDGRLVTFESTAPDLVPGDGNGASDVFVHDRATGVTACVSCGRAGPSARPALSADGRRLAFDSAAPDLVPGDGNGVADVFWVELPTGELRRASVAAGGREATGASSGAALSGDGRLLCFGSDAADLVPGDGNGARDVFARELP